VEEEKTAYDIIKWRGFGGTCERVSPSWPLMMRPWRVRPLAPLSGPRLASQYFIGGDFFCGWIIQYLAVNGEKRRVSERGK